MKVKVFKLDSASMVTKNIMAVHDINDDALFIDCDELKISEGCYSFYNIDKQNPQLPIRKIVASFPIQHFYILTNEE